MAAHDLYFSTNDTATRKKWAKELYHAMMKDIEFTELVGSGGNYPIELKNDLGKGEGDQITFTIRIPATQPGIIGQKTVEGNEERLIFRNFNVTIEELNFAVDTGGKMDEQRVPFNLLQEGKDALQELWADRLSDYMFAILCSDTSYTMGGETFITAPTAVDSDHLLRVNDAATDAAMTEADMMDLTFLDRMRQLAEVPTGADCYKVRPWIIGGKKYFRVILHNYVFDRLKMNMQQGQLGDMIRSANKLNVQNVEFEYNGLLVMKSERVRHSSTNSNVYHNILLGQQAAVWAWGGAGESKSTTMSFVPYEKDAKRFVMVRGGGIFGMQKTRFNSKDYGIIVGRSYATKL